MFLSNLAVPTSKMPPGGIDGSLIVWGAGIASAMVTNDAVCVLGAPFVVALVARYRLPAAPYVIGLATAANTGSVATLVSSVGVPSRTMRPSRRTATRSASCSASSR